MENATFKTRFKTPFPDKRTFLWDKFENRQLKLHEEYDGHFMKIIGNWGTFPLCKIETIFADFSDMAIATNDSMAPVLTISDAPEVGFEVFERLKNFTFFRNNAWNPPLLMRGSHSVINFNFKNPYNN